MAQHPPPIIETRRLRLRPPSAADLEPWTERIFADPEVTRYVPSRIVEPQARAERMLAAISDSWARRGYGIWLVTDKEAGELIGHCGLGHLPDTDEVEIDYALAQAHWGKGIATEAAQAVLRFGFASAGLELIIGLAVPENIASRRVLEHVGFVYQRDAPYFGLSLAYHTLEPERFWALNP
jgi:ribosomal-protein-alanine N-acetyltransferase